MFRTGEDFHRESKGVMKVVDGSMSVLAFIKFHNLKKGDRVRAGEHKWEVLASLTNGAFWLSSENYPDLSIVSELMDIVSIPGLEVVPKEVPHWRWVVCHEDGSFYVVNGLFPTEEAVRNCVRQSGVPIMKYVQKIDESMEMMEVSAN